MGSPKLDINLGYNKDYWESIASKICYIGQPTEISKDMGVLRITLDSEGFRQVVQQTNMDAESGYINPIKEDEIVVKKL